MPMYFAMKMALTFMYIAEVSIDSMHGIENVQISLKTGVSPNRVIFVV